MGEWGEKHRERERERKFLIIFGKKDCLIAIFFYYNK